MSPPIPDPIEPGPEEEGDDAIGMTGDKGPLPGEDTEGGW